MEWIDGHIAVPFGNANYDSALGGSHDMTFALPPNTTIFQLAAGTVSDISSPSWGMQVCIKLDEPVEGHDYFAILHLSAVNPALHVGHHMNPNDIVGWSGGCVTSGQYNGTHNPTGQDFLNSPAMSSQPQVGIALHDGPSYGGKGWKTFPPIDTTLDPGPIVDAYRKNHQPTPPQVDANDILFRALWVSVVPNCRQDTGIFKAVYKDYLANKNRGPALTNEITVKVGTGNSAIYQIFAMGMYEWVAGKGTWYPFKG